MTLINDRVNAMVAKSLQDPEDTADALEALANGIAGLIVLTVRGNQAKAETMLQGTEAYIQNAVSDKLQALKAFRQT